VDEVENWLLSTRLRTAAERLAAGADGAEADAIWREAFRSVEAAGADEVEDVALPVMEKSLPDLQALLARWDAGKAPLPEWDKEVLKRAMKAWKRRLEITRGDDEITGGRNPLSRGASSSITGVKGPERYPPDVWALLVKQGKLRDAGHGLLELTS
jgi:hypothetical protein